jgi:hypothetical protein
VAIPGSASGKALLFKTVQTYSNGQVVHWIEPSLEAEHPAPRINVTAKGGVVEELAGDEAGPTAGETAVSATAASTSASHSSSSGSDEGLAIAALVVGALGLLVGGIALIRVRAAGTPR